MRCVYYDRCTLLCDWWNVRCLSVLWSLYWFTLSVRCMYVSWLNVLITACIMIVYIVMWLMERALSVRIVITVLIYFERALYVCIMIECPYNCMYCDCCIVIGWNWSRDTIETLIHATSNGIKWNYKWYIETLMHCDMQHMRHLSAWIGTMTCDTTDI